MKKIKAIFFYVFVIGGLGAAVFGYFYLKQNKKPALNAMDVLPEKALCVFSSSNFHELVNKLSNQNLIWNELVNITEFKKLSLELQHFDSLISEVEILKEFFTDRQIFFAYYRSHHPSGALITFNLKDLTQTTDFIDGIEKALTCEVNNEGECEYWNGTKRYNLKVADGVVAVSESKELVQNCFNKTIKKQSENLQFRSLINNLEADDLFNVYFDHSLFNAVNDMIDTHHFILNGVSVCNIEITPDEVTANGFNDGDSLSALNVLAGQPAQNCDFFQTLPFNTLTYKAISIGNYSLFKRKIQLSREAKVFWKQAGDLAMFNCERQMEENVNSKAIEAEFTVNGAKHKAIAVEIKDSALVNEVLKVISDSITVFQGINTFRLNDSVGSLSEAMFGKILNIHSACAFTFANYLVLTENNDANVFYMNSLLNNSSIVQNELFMNYAKDNLLVNFNYQEYCTVNKEPESIKKIFVFLPDSSLKYFQKLSHWSINISNHKNLLQFRTNIKYQQLGQSKEVPGLWTCEADTVISSRTGTFMNHKSGENELVFQDAKKNLYLVNATGNILWKKQISEEVVSEFYTVDAFKNNKFQIVFNTANCIHLIDRNGNYVQGFPVKLPATATNPLTLLDYEHTKDYRLIMACSDNKIYNYNINGTKNEKFTPIRTEHAVSQQIKYAKVGASDYLIATDAEGKIYIYSRRGEGRIDLTNKLVTNSKEYFIDATNNIQTTSLVYFDDKNSLLGKINLADGKDAVKIGAEFEEARYFFELIDDDKKTDLVISDRTKVVCYDFNGNELFRYENEDENYLSTQYYYDADGAYFVLNNAIGEVHIVQASSKKSVKKIKGNGYPLVYDLFKDGKKYLLVSDGNLLKCVLLK